VHISAVTIFCNQFQSFNSVGVNIHPLQVQPVPEDNVRCTGFDKTCARSASVTSVWMYLIHSAPQC